MRSCAAFEFHSILAQVASPQELSAFIALLRILQTLKTSYCSVLPISGTMTSADFWQFSHTSLHGLLYRTSSLQLICQTSPGKNAYFHSIYLLHLHRLFRIVLGFVLSCKLTQQTYALYAICVPQTRALPPTSFRFHLMMDTLVLS